MKDTRLLKLIRTFTKEELKSFEKFLQSPFLRPARDTTGLYNYIIKYFPEYDPENLEKKKIYKKNLTIINLTLFNRKIKRKIKQGDVCAQGRRSILH